MTNWVQRRLGLQASLKQDRQRRAAKVGEEIESHLAGGDVQEAWCCVKGWYRQVSETGTKPCFATMEQQTRGQEELYARNPPPGANIPVNVEPYAINDSAPGNDEIREQVRGLRNGRASGALGIRPENMKEWLRGVIDEEECEDESK